MRKRRRGGRKTKETGSGRSIDPSASSSRKQVSPRKTGLIRKILIFIHTRRGGDGGDGGRPGGKAISKSPGDEKWMAGLLFSIRRVRIMYIYTQSGFFFQSAAQYFLLLQLEQIIGQKNQ